MKTGSEEDGFIQHMLIFDACCTAFLISGASN